MSNFYCPRIKNGIAFTPNRDYDVCGVRDLNNSSKLGISSTSLNEFLSSDYRKNLIDTANKGEWPKGCEGCFWLENISLQSPRQQEIELEKEKGVQPLVHFNSGSICDSDCIMCGPRWSTSIANRLKKYPAPSDSYFTLGNDGIDLPSDKSSLENLKNAIAISKRLKVVGGEPLLDKKLWKFLDEVTQDNSDFELIISTNGNNYPTKYQLDVLQKFTKVNFIFSIDGTGITFEWIRQNLNYKSVIKHYLKIKSMRNVSCHITAVVQAHNLLNLKSMMDSFKSNIAFNMLTHPAILSIRNAPRWVLEQALEETKENIDLQKMLSLAINAGPTHDMQSLINHTNYLNSHRTHYFNVDTWSVQKKS
jgi:sulfatase maturation enzyme AslB (radical SAM superfamily)